MFKETYQKCKFVFRTKSGKTELKITNQKNLASEFLKVISVVHECMADVFEEKVSFQGQSPDEIALVEFAQQHGYEFVSASDE